ncbi:hypothetical protein CTheo_3106 [Ceratobasidium theobromae]|uniref:Uncharacterized protein n=1 Tax=Ceratobasidium theobromae TaxID=1582974 RepID=A0A5N5QNX7_9AGAM|nr:hypothetical protein CTheo_3106 [Ceratobasidium theobromae]
MPEVRPYPDPLKKARLAAKRPSAPDAAPDPKKRKAEMDTATLPTPALIAYLVKHDALPPIHPSPSTPHPARLPCALLDDPADDPPILTDLDAVHPVLAKLVERHWHSKPPRESDTIAGFVWAAQRARERSLLAAASR